MNTRKAEKWYKHELNSEELKKFIENAREGKEGNALLGKVSDKTRNIVKEKTGIMVSKIILEGTSVIHAEESKHKLKPDDIENCVRIINNPTNVKLLPTTDNQRIEIIGI